MAAQQPLLRQWMQLRMLSARRHGVAVRELADEFGVSIKTIRRDLLMLRQAGFPLEESESEHGRKHWHVQNGHPVPELGFTVTEVLSLYLGRRLLEPLAGTYFWDGAQSAFRKIQATFGEQALRYLEKIAASLHHTAIGVGDYSRKAEVVDALMIGIEDRKVTFITYRSMRSTEPVTSDVYPYGLVHHRGSLYLVAHAVEHDEVRHYKVDRIDDAEVQGLQFTRPADFDLSAHLANTFGVFERRGPPIIVRIRFAPEAARYVEESRWHPSQTLIPQRDGSLLAEFALSATEEVKSWVLSFGSKAEVLEPKELRTEMADELDRARAAYRHSRRKLVGKQRK